MQKFAIKALEKNNEDDARKFLEQKASLSAKQAGLQETWELAHTNAEHMKEMHSKLVSDINELESRKQMIKGKLAVAKTQERILPRSSLRFLRHWSIIFSGFSALSSSALMFADMGFPLWFRRIERDIPSRAVTRPVRV